MADTFDYIIVGSGAAGSTLACRLAESGHDDILVVEHGVRDRNPLHRVPKGFFFTLNGDRYTYRYPTEPIPGTATAEVWTRGRVVGGSTTINGMMYSRGSTPDFEALAKHAGAAHWGWDTVLAAYRAMEDHDLGSSPTRGVGGRLGVSAGGPHDELTDRIFEAASTVGWEQVADVNDGVGERIGFTPSTVKNGRRISVASAFLRPALRTGRVRLATRTQIGRLLLRDGRAYGVEGMHRGSTVEFHARKEVIIACGTVETPLLLERSGIGRGGVLRKLGIDVVVESPNVGERVIEHHSPGRVQVRLNRRLGATEHLNSLFKQGAQGALYLARRRGPIATAGYDFTFHCKSEPGLERPDLTGSVTPFALDPSSGKMKLADHSGLLVGLYQTRPETRSSIHSSGRDASSPPVIAPRYFETETDTRATGLTLRRMREYLAARPLAEIIDFEEYPTSAVSDQPETTLAHARRSGGTIFHAVGSCAMGPRDDDVVDEQLRVRGIDRLRVVDASVLPFHVSGNPAAPVMAIGWIAANLIADS
ncbi:GMC family oxidoreductase [Rhodococcus koreensis]